MRTTLHASHFDSNETENIDNYLNLDEIYFIERNYDNAKLASSYPDGTIVHMAGFAYIVDNSKHGKNSATNDLNVDGLIPYGEINVFHFGAINDDASKFSNAVENAINYVDGTGALISFEGIQIKTLKKPIVLDGAKNVILDGHGATISKEDSGTGSVSMIFNLKGGVEDIQIRNFNLNGGWDQSNPSTGSNPVILIGDQLNNGDDGFINKNIKIYNNHIKGANLAGVLVYGRSNDDISVTPLNKNVHIYDNNISDSAGAGVFIYKNAEEIFVYNNDIMNVGADGISFDTLAETDRNFQSERLLNVHAWDNNISYFGHSSQAEGILFKGEINYFSSIGNDIRDSIVYGENLINRGILTTRDFYGSSVSNGFIVNNSITNINGSSESGSFGIFLNEGTESISVTDNFVHNTSDASLVVRPGTSNIVIKENIWSDSGDDYYMSRIEGREGGRNDEIEYVSNVHIKGEVFNPIGGLIITYTDNLSLSDNIFIGLNENLRTLFNTTQISIESNEHEILTEQIHTGSEMNDVFIGGLSGSSSIFGGDGDDIFFDREGSNYFVGGRGEDSVRFNFSQEGVDVNLVTGLSHTSNAQLDRLFSIENITGSMFSDYLMGDDLNSNKIYALEGDDVIYGLDGSDFLIGGEGDDYLYGGEGRDVMRGGAGGDVIFGGGGEDWIQFDESLESIHVDLELGNGVRGSSGGDEYYSVENVRGTEYSDIIIGNSDKNIILSGAGNDTIIGGGGDDVLDGGAGSDFLDGGDGSDWLRYMSASSRVAVNLFEGAGFVGEASGDVIVNIEWLWGSEHSDLLIGDNNPNMIRGGPGNDTINGMGGNDVLNGNGGDDLFLFESGGGIDRLHDFEIGSDAIQVIGKAHYSELSIYEFRGDTAVSYGFGDVIILVGIDMIDLREDMFFFE